MEEVASKEETKNKAECYKMAGDLMHKINTIENEKLYLKQSYDTIKHFNSLHKMYLYYEKCDSIERDTTHNDKPKFRFRKNSVDKMKFHRRNLISGGLFFLRKEKYVEAYNLFDTYLRTAEMPMLKSEIGRASCRERVYALV